MKTIIGDKEAEWIKATSGVNIRGIRLAPKIILIYISDNGMSVDDT